MLAEYEDAETWAVLRKALLRIKRQPINAAIAEKLLARDAKKEVRNNQGIQALHPNRREALSGV